MPRDVLQFLMRQVRIEGPRKCWVWCGSVDRDGYGKIGGKLVHRVAYELVVGPIPVGLVLDHIICDTPGCIRPDHVKPVTAVENTMRGNSPPARNARKTACEHGHAFDEANTYRFENRRCCRACNVVAVQKYKAAQRHIPRIKDIELQSGRRVA